MHRTWGSVIAGVLFVLPSLFILIALSWMYIAFGEVPVVAGLFYGIKPAVTAIFVRLVNADEFGKLSPTVQWLSFTNCRKLMSASEARMKSSEA